ELPAVTRPRLDGRQRAALNRAAIGDLAGLERAATGRRCRRATDRRNDLARTAQWERLGSSQGGWRRLRSRGTRPAAAAGAAPATARAGSIARPRASLALGSSRCGVAVAERLAAALAGPPSGFHAPALRSGGDLATEPLAGQLGRRTRLGPRL